MAIGLPSSPIVPCVKLFIMRAFRVNPDPDKFRRLLRRKRCTIRPQDRTRSFRIVADRRDCILHTRTSQCLLPNGG